MDAQDKIFVGTSGYVFPDWAGTFYPRGLRRELWLRYYIEHFKSLELNTTFYAIPEAKRMADMARKFPDDFNLHIKLPQKITHERGIDIDVVKAVIDRFISSVKPFAEKGILRGYLAQFPFSFRPTRENERFFLAAASLCPRPLFVEFRNKQWLSEATMRRLADEGIGWVVPDVPDVEGLMPNTPILTTGVGYIRLHGRNKVDWYSSERDRYNYAYSDDELSDIFNLARSLIEKGAKKVFVYFNNCHFGRAAVNAKKFAQMLGLLPPEQRLL